MRDKKRLEELESYDLDGGYPKEQLRAITKLASRICKTPVSLIDIIDESNQRTIAAYGNWEEKVVPREKSICDYVVLEDKVLIINNLDEFEAISSRLSEEDRSKIQFYAGAPIRTPNGFNIGALCVIDSIPRELTELQIESLQLLAEDVMARLELHRQAKLLKINNNKLKKYAIFLKNSADLLCTVNPRNQRILDINDDCKNIIGYEKTELVGRKFTEFVEPEEEVFEKVNKWILNGNISGKRLSIPIKIKHKKNIQKWFRFNFTAEDQILYVTARDITDQKMAENKIINLQQKFEKIAIATSDVIWELNVENKALHFSEDFAELFGYSNAERNVTTDWWLQRVHPDERNIIYKSFEKTLSSKKQYWSNVYRFMTKKSDYRYVYDNAYIDRDSNDKPTYVIGAMADITELKQAELHQKKLLSRLNQANHIAELGYWEINLNDNSVFWSDEMYHILNTDKLTTEPSLDFILDSVPPDTQKKLLNMIDQISNGNGISELEHEITLPDITVKYLYHRGELQHKEHGSTKTIIITTQDITRRKGIELKLSKSLKDQAALLSEIHHRVKNNLAIISGLLELELYHLDINEKKLSDFIRKSQLRILSMSKIYEILYKSETFKHVSFKEYIADFLNFTNILLSETGSVIEFNTQVDDIVLNINQAIPCGLILNELITNSMKHAFPDKTEGIIDVIFTENNKQVKLKVSDNGIGLPKDFEIESSKKLGLTLVKTLTSQLDGKCMIDYDSDDGFACEISFEISDIKGSGNSLF